MAGTATHLPAGPVASSASIPADEVREYERILKISDEIFAGSHPRLKVPQQFVRKPTARSGQNVPLPSQIVRSKPSTTIAEKTTAPKTARPTSNPKAPVSRVAPSALPANAATSSPRVTTKPVSEIDPIFLTKSDDLVRAELQLQRQRVERTIRDQIEQKKHDAKQKPAISDTKPEFDVSDVLQRALQVVRPLSFSDQSEANDANAESFDENSFYSSRAPDSPQPVESQRRASAVNLAQPSGPAARVPPGHYADELQRLEALNQSGSDQEMQDAYPVADQTASLHQKPPFTGQEETSHQPYESQQVDALEEPEYSPPAPVVPPIYQRVYEQESASESNNARHLDRYRDPRQPVSPAGPAIVRQNHITSPAAPRPSRVSPLARAKIPSVQQTQEIRGEQESDQLYTEPDPVRGSPSGPAPHIRSRKRRRLQGEAVESPRKVPYGGPNAQTTDAYIKDEPISPPPFADDPVIIRGRRPQEPMYVDIASPRYTPVLEGREPSVRRPVYEAEPYHEVPLDQDHSRASSRLGTRRAFREEGDLRRVASLHHARQAEYPREYVETDSRGSRAASYTVTGRPPQERPRYYEEIPSAYGPRYVSVDDLPRPVYREAYYEDVPPARMIAPPQRRIVIDEHGNEYEMIPTSRHQPMAPPPRPVSRMPQPEILDEPVPARTVSVRAPSVVQDPYGERRYTHEMPPPQPVYRRVVSDYARPAVSDRRMYATPAEGHEPYSRAGSVQIAEYLPQPTYVEDHALSQERVIRTPNVRSHQSRYEEPYEVVPRMGSVRPAAQSRNPGFFVGERRMREYTEHPHDMGLRRYYDGGEAERIALEDAEPVQRVPQHYR